MKAKKEKWSREGGDKRQGDGAEKGEIKDREMEQRRGR